MCGCCGCCWNARRTCNKRRALDCGIVCLEFCDERASISFLGTERAVLSRHFEVLSRHFEVPFNATQSRLSRHVFVRVAVSRTLIRNKHNGAQQGAAAASYFSTMTTPMNNNNNDDKKEDFVSVFEDAHASLLPPSDCGEAVLETMDNCVACMDNVDAQHEYEQTLEDSHTLRAAEASQIRLQVMEETKTPADTYFPDFRDLNLCGTDDLEDARTTLQHAVPYSKTNTTTRVDDDDNKRPSSPPTLYCAICFDDVQAFQTSGVTFCDLPCCGSHGREARSTTKICTACMLLLSSPTSSSDDARVGRCPRCRSWLLVKDAALTIAPLDKAGKCRVCNQVKEHLVQDDDDVCDACFLGRTRPLFYECKECRHPQLIPHPMYRYQFAVDEFGTTSWACQGPCQNFTMWRIYPEQVQYIPAGDAPASWGDDYLETARERVMEARRNMAALQNQGANGCNIQ